MIRISLAEQQDFKDYFLNCWQKNKDKQAIEHLIAYHQATIKKFSDSKKDLRASMIALLKKHPQWEQQDFKGYFINCWENDHDQIVIEHLIAYHQPNIDRFSELKQFVFNSHKNKSCLKPENTYQHENRIRIKQMIALVQQHPEWEENDFALYFRERFLNYMETLVHQHPEWEEEDLRKHLYRCSKVQGVQARSHLMAYLQPTANLAINNFLEYGDVIPGNTLAEKCEICIGKIKEFLYNLKTLIKHLTDYDPNYRNPENNQGIRLKNYLYLVFKNVLKGQFPIISDQRLLCDGKYNPIRPYTRACKNFMKKLRYALENRGFHEPEITWRIFVWEYFCIEYRNNTLLPFLNNPNRRRGEAYPKFPAQDYEDAAKVVNRNRHASHAPPEVITMPDVTKDTVIQWMQDFIDGLRNLDNYRVAKSKIEGEFRDRQRDNQLEIEEQEQNNDELRESIIYYQCEQLKQYLKTDGFLDFENFDYISKTYRELIKRHCRAIAPLTYGSLSPLTQEEFIKIITDGKSSASKSISQVINKVYINPLTEKLKNLINQEKIEELNVRENSWYRPYIIDFFWYRLYLKDFLENRYTLGKKYYTGQFDEIAIKVIELQSNQNIKLLKLYGSHQEEVDELKIDIIIDSLLPDFHQTLTDKQKKNQVKQLVKDYHDNLMDARLKSCYKNLPEKDKAAFELFVQGIDIDQIENCSQQQKNELRQRVSDAQKHFNTQFIATIKDDFKILIPENNAHSVIEKWAKSYFLIN